MPLPNQAPLTRSDTREIAELRRLREEQPELAAAVDLQVELLQLQRRVQSRVSLPSISLDADYLNARLINGSILELDHIPVEWGDMRFLMRSAAAAMRNHDALEDADCRRAEELARDAAALHPVVRSWYDGARPGASVAAADHARLDPVIQQAMRPFLTRAAEAIMAKIDFAGWTHGRCPLCSGDPDLAVITPAADRRLICGRCGCRWRFHPLTCPFCLNPDRSLITSFASRDGNYRLYGCDVCKRYIKAYDSRRTSRPVLPAVDGVATLPLDAAAIQKGYR